MTTIQVLPTTTQCPICNDEFIRKVDPKLALARHLEIEHGKSVIYGTELVVEEDDEEYNEDEDDLIRDAVRVELERMANLFTAAKTGGVFRPILDYDHNPWQVMATIPSDANFVDIIPILDQLVHRTWHPFFDEIKEEINILGRTLAILRSEREEDEEPDKTYKFHCPPMGAVFAPLLLPLTSVRVVFIGQDPYPSINKQTHLPNATGFCFSMPEANGLSGSAETILTELVGSWGKIANLTGIRIPWTDRTNFNLLSWVDQGCLLLNACPMLMFNSQTSPNCWFLVMKALIEFVARQDLERSPETRLIWVLVGRSAEIYLNIIKGVLKGKNFISENVFSVPHPSRNNLAGGFVGCSIFFNINAQFVSRKMPPIIF